MTLTLACSRLEPPRRRRHPALAVSRRGRLRRYGGPPLRRRRPDCRGFSGRRRHLADLLEVFLKLGDARVG